MIIIAKCTIAMFNLVCYQIITFILHLMHILEFFLIPLLHKHCIYSTFLYLRMQFVCNFWLLSWTLTFYWSIRPNDGIYFIIILLKLIRLNDGIHFIIIRNLDIYYYHIYLVIILFILRTLIGFQSQMIIIFLMISCTALSN